MVKKKEIRIIKKNLNNENYTFVSDNSILNLENNEFVTTTTNNEKNSSDIKKTTSDDIIGKKKIHSKKADNKGRKILGKSLQGHSPVYE
ncbi:MAG TPA: hypothetical protein VF242_08475 [Nitrososphaeraceae archaeon]